MIIWYEIVTYKIENEYKVYDIAWFSKVISKIMDKCARVIFDDIKEFEIIETFAISRDVTFESTTEMNFSFKNNSSIMIKYKLKQF